MSSRERLQTKDEYRKEFDQSLSAAIDLGTMPNRHSGLDPLTRKVIEKIASEYPVTNELLIASAKRQFNAFMAWLAS